MRYRLTKSSMKLPKFNNTEYTATVVHYAKCDKYREISYSTSCRN